MPGSGWACPCWPPPSSHVPSAWPETCRRDLLEVAGEVGEEEEEVVEEKEEVYMK